MAAAIRLPRGGQNGRGHHLRRPFLGAVQAQRGGQGCHERLVDVVDRRCGALSPGSEASAVVQRELGASLHRHEVEVLAMTGDEALDEWAVGQHRQPLRSAVSSAALTSSVPRPSPSRAGSISVWMKEMTPGRRRYSAKPRTAPSTAISKRLRSETSVTVGAIAPVCALNVIVTCFAAASGQFGGASTSSRRAASLLAAVKSPNRPRTKAA